MVAEVVGGVGSTIANARLRWRGKGWLAVGRFLRLRLVGDTAVHDLYIRFIDGGTLRFVTMTSKIVVSPMIESRAIERRKGRNRFFVLV